jgi:hypothetical protein
MTLKEQSRFKYIVHIDGNVNAYRPVDDDEDRICHSPGCEHTSWAEYLKPDVHYVGVRADLTDLEERLNGA